MLERVLRWLMVGAFCSTAATCGQKGPLELPDEEVASVVPYGVVPRHPAWPMAGEGDGLHA